MRLFISVVLPAPLRPISPAWPLRQLERDLGRNCTLRDPRRSGPGMLSTRAPLDCADHVAPHLGVAQRVLEAGASGDDAPS